MPLCWLRLRLSYTCKHCKWDGELPQIVIGLVLIEASGPATASDSPGPGTRRMSPDAAPIYLCHLWRRVHARWRPPQRPPITDMLKARMQSSEKQGDSSAMVGTTPARGLLLSRLPRATPPEHWFRVLRDALPACKGWPTDGRPEEGVVQQDLYRRHLRPGKLRAWPMQDALRPLAQARRNRWRRTNEPRCRRMHSRWMPAQGMGARILQHALRPVAK